MYTSRFSTEALSLIFNYIIFDLNDFHLFSKFVYAWATRPNASRMKDLLEHLNWDALYHYHNHDFQVTREAFHGFIGFAVRYNVDQAVFLDSVQNLFRMNNVQHHLARLSVLSGNHFPSSFSYLFFKAVYRPAQATNTAQEMSLLLNTTHFRCKISEQMKLLHDVYSSITEIDYLLPVFKFCPNARNPDPLYQLDGEPFEEELWYSLCHRTVEENYRNEGEYFGKRLTMHHIWESDCGNCRLQLILFKILLGAICD